MTFTKNYKYMMYYAILTFHMMHYANKLLMKICKCKIASNVFKECKSKALKKKSSKGSVKCASVSYKNKYKNKYQNIISNICTIMYKVKKNRKENMTLKKYTLKKKNTKLLEKIIKGIFEVHMLVMKPISAKNLNLQ